MSLIFELSPSIVIFHRIYTETDSDLPSYPDHFQVAKYSIFEKVKLQFISTTTAITVIPQLLL